MVNNWETFYGWEEWYSKYKDTYTLSEAVTKYRHELDLWWSQDVKMVNPAGPPEFIKPRLTLIPGSIKAFWTFPGTQCSTVEILRSTDNENFTPITTVNVKQDKSRTYADTTVTPETLYYYKLKLTSVLGKVLYSNVASLVAPTPLPTIGTLSSSTDYSTLQTTLDWVSVTDADNVKVYVDDSLVSTLAGSSTSSTSVNYTPPTGSSYSIYATANNTAGTATTNTITVTLSGDVPSQEVVSITALGSGTQTVPTSSGLPYNKVIVEAWGGGGSGQKGAGTSLPFWLGAGGGGGAYVKKTWYINEDDSFSYSVGQGAYQTQTGVGDPSIELAQSSSVTYSGNTLYAGEGQTNYRIDGGTKYQYPSINNDGVAGGIASASFGVDNLDLYEHGSSGSAGADVTVNGTYSAGAGGDAGGLNGGTGGDGVSLTYNGSFTGITSATGSTNPNGFYGLGDSGSMLPGAGGGGSWGNNPDFNTSTQPGFGAPGKVVFTFTWDDPRV